MARTNYDNEKVKKLLDKAMDGRSAKEYSEATEINPAIISRIRSGDYRPGKKILGQIAKENPKAVSIDELMEAAGYSEKDISETKERALAKLVGTLAGTGTTIAGINAITAAATAAGATGAFSFVPIAGPIVTAGMMMYRLRKSASLINEYKNASIDEHEKKKVEQLKANRKRFKTMVMGIMYQSLISRNLVSKTIDEKNVNEENLFLKESLFVDDQKGNSRRLELHFAHYEEGILDELPLSEDDLAIAVLSILAFDEPDESKQIDIITNNKKYFASLTEFANKTSIKANIVTMLVDIDNAEIVNEAVISTYGDRDEHVIYFKETEPQQ